ncbi:MAG: D-alanyl-D-alanine carboxypeptidase family protein [Bacillota bacterium]|nr:D-alanyl-D-alanine carboxypeptidase family protein [Bacillota bacterium]
MKRKLKKWEKIGCWAVAAMVLAGGGFMGVKNFVPEQRSLTIVDEASVVSSQTPAEGNAESGAEETAAATSAETVDLKVDGKAAILIDGSSGKVLFEQNAHKHLPPASVTKVMTLLLIMEGCDSGKIALDDKVTISERAASMGGSQMYMEVGEQHSVEELLKGVIMVSANDGCVALAEHLSGSVESFVDSMNKRAEEMGLKDSHFVNTNGLPVANHYSCAYDIGMISKELMKYDKTHKWFTAWQEDIQVGLPGKKSKFTLTNTNKLIRSYSGAIGVKTGFTQDAGYCLSGAADRDGTRMIGVVLGCKTSDIRFAEMAKLLDYGFANYETVQLASEGEKIDTLKITKGDREKLFAVAKEQIGITVKKGEVDKVKTKTKLDESISLPVKKGDPVGSLVIYENKKKTGEYELVSDRDVKRAGIKTIYIRMMKKLV